MTNQYSKVLPEAIVEFIQECMQKPEPKSFLIAVLHKVQGHYGYLPTEALEDVSQLMQIPSAKISGVATFYHFFRLQKVGKHRLGVCTGTACHVKGANKLIDAISRKLMISVGETTKDNLFTLETTRCVGMCAMAPLVEMNEKLLSHVSKEELEDLIDKIFAEEKPVEGK